MTFWEKVNAFFMSDTYFSICLFLLGVAALIWCVEMVCDTFVKRKSVADFITDCEHKLNALLDLHNVHYWRDVYEPSITSTRDVLDEINEKLDVLLSGPMDKVTIEELNAQREDQPGINAVQKTNNLLCKLNPAPKTAFFTSVFNKPVSVQEKLQLLYADKKTKKSIKVSDLLTRIILNITYFTSYCEDEADIENIVFVAPKEYSFDLVLTIALEYFHTVLKLCGHFESINIYYSESLPEETCIPVYDIDKCEEEMKPPRHCLKGGPNCPFWNGKEPCEKCVAEPLTKSEKCPIAPDCPFWDQGINCTMSSCILGDYIDFPGRLPSYRLISDSEDKPGEV